MAVNWDSVVSTKHIAILCQDYLEKWRLLSDFLDLKDTTIPNITREGGSEEDMKKKLLKTWKQEKGNGATYRVLHKALVDNKSQGDADFLATLVGGGQPSSAAPVPGPLAPVVGPPAPVAAASGEATFIVGTIVDELATVQEKTYKIAVQIGVPGHEIREFQKRADDPLSSIIERWLNGDYPEGRHPCWQSVVDILNTKSVGEYGLAKRIKKDYIGVGSAVSTNKDAVLIDSSNHSSTGETGGQVFPSHECEYDCEISELADGEHKCFVTSQLNLKRIHDEFGIKGSGIKLAVIERGCYNTHKALNGKVKMIQVSPFNGKLNHGTAVAGIAAGQPYTSGKISYPGGVAPDADITMFCVDSTRKSVLDALKQISQRKGGDSFDVLSISLGTENKVDEKMVDDFQEVIKSIREEGTVIFAASGNIGRLGKVLFPARLDGVIKVGGLDHYGEFLSSARKEGLDIYCCGKIMAPTSGTDELKILIGSSMATPAAAGLACLAIQLAKDCGYKGLRHAHNIKSLFKEFQAPGSPNVFEPENFLKGAFYEGRALRKRVSAKYSKVQRQPSISPQPSPKKARLWIIVVGAGIMIVTVAVTLAYFKPDFQLENPQDVSQHDHHKLCLHVDKSDLHAIEMKNLERLTYIDTQGKEQPLSIVGKVSPKWRDIASLVGYEDEADKIAAGFNMNDPSYTDKCFRALMKMWLENEGTEEYPSSWNGLISILERIGHKRIANIAIKHVLC